jgi:hypothetical protein
MNLVIVEQTTPCWCCFVSGNNDYYTLVGNWNTTAPRSPSPKIDSGQ